MMERILYLSRRFAKRSGDGMIRAGPAPILLFGRRLAERAGGWDDKGGPGALIRRVGKGVQPLTRSAPAGI